MVITISVYFWWYLVHIYPFDASFLWNSAVQGNCGDCDWNRQFDLVQKYCGLFLHSCLLYSWLEKNTATSGTPLFWITICSQRIAWELHKLSYQWIRKFSVSIARLFNFPLICRKIQYLLIQNIYPRTGFHLGGGGGHWPPLARVLLPLGNLR